MHLHISNLNSNIVETDLYKIFSYYREVENVTLVRDKLNNRAGGRAFVEMPVIKKAQAAAITQLHLSQSNYKKSP